MKHRSQRDTPLECRVRSDKLSVVIGVDTLAFADIERRNNELPEGTPKYRIIDPNVFAQDVVRELLREDEIGASLLTDVLDKAMDRAIDRGSEAIEEIRENLCPSVAKQTSSAT